MGYGFTGDAVDDGGNHEQHDIPIAISTREIALVENIAVKTLV